jgi:hypothetical protein
MAAGADEWRATAAGRRRRRGMRPVTGPEHAAAMRIDASIAGSA